MKAFGTLTFAFLAACLQTLVGGFVLSKLWAWFIVPKFTGAPSLGYVDAVGVGLVVHTLLASLFVAVSTRQPSNPDNDKPLALAVRSLVMALLGYPFALLSGYLWSLFL